MKRSRHTKWLVIIGALMIFFSVGAVAWAAGGDGGGQEPVGDGTAGLRGLGMMIGQDDQDEVAGDCEGRRQALQERREQRRERLEALLDGLRDDMSPEDQAAYDQLKTEIEEKRAALEAAREDLTAALKELRDLTDEYLDLGD